MPRIRKMPFAKKMMFVGKCPMDKNGQHVQSCPLEIRKKACVLMQQNVFSKVLWRYAALEREVQLLIDERCGKVCSLCPSCCCRTDICEEAFDSLFLRKLHGQTRRSVSFSERYGWRTERGCGLALGRPPVCYEFFCEDLLRIQPDSLHRYALLVLGRLVDHIGRDALGHTHLVNITDEADLQRLSFDRFNEKFSQAHTALQHIRFFCSNGVFNSGAAQQLRPVLRPPAELQ